VIRESLAKLRDVRVVGQPASCCWQRRLFEAISIKSWN